MGKINFQNNELLKFTKFVEWGIKIDLFLEQGIILTANSF